MVLSASIRSHWIDRRWARQGIPYDRGFARVPLDGGERRRLASSAIDACQPENTARAAAIAGILFSLLLIASLWLLRLSISRDPLEISAWMEKDAARVTLRAEPRAVRRHRVHVVPWCPARPPWRQGGQVLRNGVPRQRLDVPGHAVRRRLSNQAASSCHIPPRRMRGRLIRDLRTPILLRHHAYLRLQDGGCLHDHDVHACAPHPLRGALDCDPGLRIGADYSFRKRLFSTGCCSSSLAGCLWSAFIS